MSNELINKTDLDFKALALSETIESVSNASDKIMQRARVNFVNGHSLSIIRGPCSYGGDEGLFEIMPSEESMLEGDHSGDTVAGYLTADDVMFYINKIGSLQDKTL